MYMQYNAQPIWLSPSAVRLVYSNVSDTGYWGYTVEHGGLHVAQGSWLPGEAAQSSTGRELVVVLRVLDSIAHNLCNMRVLVGSRQTHLKTDLLKIVEVCMLNGAWVHIQVDVHVPQMSLEITRMLSWTGWMHSQFTGVKRIIGCAHHQGWWLE